MAKSFSWMEWGPVWMWFLLVYGDWTKSPKVDDSSKLPTGLDVVKLLVCEERI